MTVVPLGARIDGNGTSFAVFSSVAEAVELCLFDDEGQETRRALEADEGYVWRAQVDGVGHGARYGFRVHGAWDPGAGVGGRNPAESFILDPYARAVADVPERLRGTYAGVAEPAVIDHLTRLGVTAVEFLPVHHFVHDGALVARGLRNYWGYQSIGFFAPHNEYSSSGDRGGQVDEFKAMVKSLHAAGLEVTLDVVFNHTAEGNEQGPTLCFRGLDNGGFRFDLAAALGRGSADFDPHGAFLEAIGQDPVLGGVKLIAEPWDVGFGGYELGDFPPGWSEWNGRYRDTVRDFWRSADGTLSDFATRLTGSSDLYGRGRRPTASINLVTVHDGFTLADLVSYDAKHNEANGEDNRDGTDDNRSWNCGVEGPTNDTAVLELRKRQRRNYLATLLLSEGVPLLVGGDEMGRTQGGNNNAYCQDNATSWVDWSLAETERDMIEFVARLCRFRLAHPGLHRRRFFAEGDIAWLRPDGKPMSDEDWAVPFAHAVTVAPVSGRLILMVNAWWDPLTFKLPVDLAGESPTVVIDTADGDPDSNIDPAAGIVLAPRSLVLLERRAEQ